MRNVRTVTPALCCLIFSQLCLQVDPVPTEKIVRVRHGKVFSLDCFSETAQGRDLRWCQLDSKTKECEDPLSAGWNKNLFSNAPRVIPYGNRSELLIPEATYKKVGIYKCMLGENPVEVFNVRLCQDIDLPKFAQSPKDIVNAHIDEVVNFTCSVNFACGKTSNISLRLEDMNGRIVQEATNVSVDSETLSVQGRTTFYDIVVTAQLMYKVVTEEDLVVVCSFDTDEKKNENSSAKLTTVKSTRNEGNVTLLVIAACISPIVALALILFVIIIIIRLYKTGKMFLSHSFQPWCTRDKDKKYDVLLYDCETKSTKVRLLNYLKSMDLDVCTSDDSPVGKPTLDELGQLSVSSQCVIFMYNECILDSGNENGAGEMSAEINNELHTDCTTSFTDDVEKENRRKMHSGLLNAVKGALKIKSRRRLTLICETSEVNISKKYLRSKFSDSDSDIQSIHHIFVNDSGNLSDKFRKEIKKRTPRPTGRTRVPPKPKVSTKSKSDEDPVRLLECKDQT